MLANIIGTTRKSRSAKLNDEAIIVRAVRAAAGIPLPLPVYSNDGRFLGTTCGLGYNDPRVIWYDKRYFGYDSYDDIIAESTKNQKRYSILWGKNFNNSPTAESWADMWPLAGNPTVGAYSGTAATARQFTDSTQGSIQHGGHVSTDTKHILGGWISAQSEPWVYMLYDRVLTYDNSPYNAGVQSMTNTLPALRYIAAGQPGLQIMLTVCTTTGGNAANLTVLTYVDNAGNTHTMPVTNSVGIVASVTQGSADTCAKVVAPNNQNSQCVSPFLPLAGGDLGVRSITNYTTDANTGTLCFALIKPLALLTVPSSNEPAMFDFVLQNPNLERIYDGACLGLAVRALGTNASVVFGGLEFGWG